MVRRDETETLVHALCRRLGDDTRLIETHISWVLLSGERARKIKKPVDLGFLDFSTLEKRRFYCEEELRLNRRLASEWYLGVVAIGGAPDRPCVPAQGKAIEYFVEMRRFPDAARLDRLLEQGRLDAARIDAFARRIARFYQGLPGAPPDSPYGRPEAVYAPVAENFAELRGRLGDAAEPLAWIEAWSRAEFERQHERLAQRRRQGWIRECHGDLHLGNLAWVDGQPLVFDCIEFSPALRWIDPVNEIAFLLMDLRARGRADLGWGFLDTWLEITGDFAGLALMRFYRVYRAMVRAKVEAIQAGQRGGDPSAALRYLGLARELTGPASPRLLLTHGFSASGKSTLSRQLVERLGAVRLRSDVERKRLFGVPAGASARAAPGRGIYTADASRRVYARLLDLTGELLDAGWTVIVDAAFLEAARRAPFQRLAERRGVPWTLLPLEVPTEILRQRIRRRQGDVSDADLEVLEHQLAHHQPLSAAERRHAIPVDAGQPLDLDGLIAALGEVVAGGPMGRQDVDHIEAGFVVDARIDDDDVTE